MAIFDLLTKPDPVLTDDEQEMVKASAKRLLSHLHDKLVLDWRRRAATTADVRVTILDVLDEDLPEDPYPPEVFDAKVQAVFDHILTAYGDDGSNVYDQGEAEERTPAAGVAVLQDQDHASMTEAVVERIRTDAEFASLIADQLGLPGGPRCGQSKRSSLPTRTTPWSSSQPRDGIYGKASPIKRWKTLSSRLSRASSTPMAAHCSSE